MKWKWTKNPKLRWIGLNDVVTVYLMLVNTWLVYAAAMGRFDATMQAAIVGGNMLAAGIAFYWLYGPEAAEGGSDVFASDGSGETIASVEKPDTDESDPAERGRGDGGDS